MDVITLFSVVVAAACLPLGQAIVTVQLDEVALQNGYPGCRLMPRSNATNQQNVWMFQGESLTLNFCLDNPALVSVDDFIYSNDGWQDSVLIAIDDEPLADVETHDTSFEGELWNIFSGTGPQGKQVSLQEGSHTLTVSVTQADKWGVELDALVLRVMENGNSGIDDMKCEGDYPTPAPLDYPCVVDDNAPIKMMPASTPGQRNLGVSGTTDSSVTDSSGGSVTDSSGGSVTESSGGSVTENNGAAVTDNNGATVTDSDGGSVTDSSGGTVTDKNGGYVTDTNGGYVTDNNGGYVTDNNGRHVTDKNGGYVTDNNGGYVTDKNGGYVTNNNGGYVTDNNGGYVTDNNGGYVTDNNGGSVTDPTSRSSTGQYSSSSDNSGGDQPGSSASPSPDSVTSSGSSKVNTSVVFSGSEGEDITIQRADTPFCSGGQANYDIVSSLGSLMTLSFTQIITTTLTVHPSLGLTTDNPRVLLSDNSAYIQAFLGPSNDMWVTMGRKDAVPCSAIQLSAADVNGNMTSRMLLRDDGGILLFPEGDASRQAVYFPTQAHVASGSPGLKLASVGINGNGSDFDMTLNTEFGTSRLAVAMGTVTTSITFFGTPLGAVTRLSSLVLPCLNQEELASAFVSSDNTEFVSMFDPWRSFTGKEITLVTTMD
ncbi:mesocentin-like isoform X2 [Haliotis rufescens]|uniref:mesocentin-like isoform X2 n=1 Tax=Haliotis rufescens TaxID=6454 RepID=UPI00201F12B8|nr:mesocentin-like isoform X2 [Haliotis rufescens]